MKIIAVGSQNPSKIQAVQRAFEKVWPNEQWQVVGVEVKSGVSDQPMSDEESIHGAMQRAQLALVSASGAVYGVGLEGGIQQIGDRCFDCGWCVIIDHEAQMGVGSSAKMPVPAKIMQLIEQGTELGFADDQVFGQEMSKHGLGHFGLMSNGNLTRTDAYRDGVIAALTRFLHPDLF